MSHIIELSKKNNIRELRKYINGIIIDTHIEQNIEQIIDPNSNPNIEIFDKKEAKEISDINCYIGSPRCNTPLHNVPQLSVDPKRIYLNMNDTKKVYHILLNNFSNTTTLTETLMYDYSEVFKFFTKNLEKNDIKKLIYKINDKLENYMDNKTIYSLLKSLYVYCNKSLYKKRTNIDSILSLFGSTDNIKHVLFYIHKLQSYIENKNNIIDYNKIIKYLERVVYDKDIITPSLLYFINKCKKDGNICVNDLEKILIKCDHHLHNYVYFLNNKKTSFIDEGLVCKFIENLGYKKKLFTVIDNLNLKRGFIFCLSKDNVDYVLKYQPNKSVMELILNCYMKKLNHSAEKQNNNNMNHSAEKQNNNMNHSSSLLHNNNNMNLDSFLLPTCFYVNHDCSYFYIIEKYHTDLYKYFNILESKNKILSFTKILEISKFLLNALTILKENSIIHGDLKLENIVLNYDDDYNIVNLKIIDFDVGLFDKIPKLLLHISPKYDKIMENKKIRGTKLYMLKNNDMCFDNDLYSFGVLMLILLYKNMKLIFSTCKNKQDDKKIIIKNENYIKRLNQLRNGLENDENKIIMLKLISRFMTENTLSYGVEDGITCGIMKRNGIIPTPFFDNHNRNQFLDYIEMITDCLKLKTNIVELNKKYKERLKVEMMESVA
jgi:hypothetical protein